MIRQKTTFLFLLTFSLVVLFINCTLFPVTCSLTYAAVPHFINYQGRLTDSNGAPLNGSYSITFRIYDAEAAGNLLWQETHSGVVIQKGIFSVLLGSVTNLDLGFDKPYFLEIKVGNEVMSPRQRIASAAYAIRAEVANKAEISEKVKLGANDTSPGYLFDKVDNNTIKIDPDTYKLYAPQTRQIFTSSGTFTAPPGVTKVYITMCGGGGGGGGSRCPGGGSSGGGGGGSMVIRYPYTVVPGNSYVVTIGLGGNGGQGCGLPATTGAAGGTTSFDSLTAVGGGGGGPSLSRDLFGDAGVGGGGFNAIGPTAGSYTLKGGDGAKGSNSTGQAAGGGTIFGPGASGGRVNNAADNSGGGGSGAGESPGGNGGSGICIVEW